MTEAERGWRNLTLIDRDLGTLLRAAFGQCSETTLRRRLPGISLKGATPQQIAEAAREPSLVYQLAVAAAARNRGGDAMVEGIGAVTRAVAARYLAATDGRTVD